MKQPSASQPKNLANKVSQSIKQMGFGEALQANLEDEKIASHEIARVITVHKDCYSLAKDGKETIAELSGKFFYSTNSPVDFPTVGDWVYTDFHDNSHAVVHGIIPRVTVLTRKTAGRDINYQLIGANIDTAFIVQSLNENFNLRRLERYLVMINESGIIPIILLSKADLISAHDMDKIVVEVSEIAPDILIIPFSNQDGANLNQIKALLDEGKTYCLVGSSGVGKSNLLNNLLGEQTVKVGSVREKDNKGRHTTTQRHLIQLQNNAMIIDTPGMRELGNVIADTGLTETFEDIVELAGQCKFNDCSHTHEKKCAILTAINDGELSEERYQNYVKMQKETSHNRVSYYEKRQKDKKFHQHVKSVISENHKHSK